MINFRSKPLVSVIIPAYNAEEFISDTIDSILNQSYPNIEIIIVDDGSKDKTAQIVKEYKDKVRYFFQENSGGCSVPRNYGIQKSLGDFLCFNDADDLMMSDRLKSQIDFLSQNPEVGLVFNDYRNFEGKLIYPKTHFESCVSLQSLIQGKKQVIIPDAYIYLAKENFGIAGSFMMRKSLLSQGFCFDPSLKSSEDFNFYYRLSRVTQVGIINEVGMMRRLHTNNMSSNVEKMMSECIRSYNMLLKSEKNIQAKYYLNKFISCFWSNLSRYNSNHGRYWLAFKQEIKALYHDLCLIKIIMFIKNILRMFMIRIGIYKSTDEIY